MPDIVTIASILSGAALVAILWRLADKADKAEMEALTQTGAPSLAPGCESHQDEPGGIKSEALV